MDGGVSIVKLGKCKVLCGYKRKNREFPRIAFFLRRRALLRLIACAGIARRLEKSTS